MYVSSRPHAQQLAAHACTVAESGLVPQMTPAVAQPDFLDALKALQPDLCVTAAYGNILPQTFLDIPRRGTLNIHPSLLPQYRGAAPVQRALQVLLAAMSAQQAAWGLEGEGQEEGPA